MRIVQLSTYDLLGGAALAAVRLHRALLTAGEDSRMLVRKRQSDRLNVMQPGGGLMKWWLRSQRRLDRLPLTIRCNRSCGFSIGWVPDGLRSAVRKLSPNVVHAHWIADGFLRLETLRTLAVPVIWTMHDMWAFTGGCHYTGDCEGFTARCGKCPVLESDLGADLSSRGWGRRHAIYEQSRFVFIAPSRWMALQARRSALLANADIRVIANGFDTAVFTPLAKKAARSAFGLPQDKLLMMAGAVQLGDPRKGFSHLRAALHALRGMISDNGVEIILTGRGVERELELEGFRTHYLGVLAGDSTLAKAFAAADIFVLPSLEDNLPNTAIEAMAAGTPVVAYSVGGVPEIIDHDRTGLLAKAAQPEALAAALARMVQEPEFRSECGRQSRLKVLNTFDSAKIAQEHRALYREVSERQ